MNSGIRRSREEKERGFTLIEFLVVMIIISILAAIAIPVFLNQRKAANDTAIKSDLRNAGIQVSTFYVSHHAYPTATQWTSLLADEIKTSDGVTLTYVHDINADSFCIDGTHQQAGNDWSYNSAAGGLSEAGVKCEKPPEIIRDNRGRTGPPARGGIVSGGTPVIIQP